jgi:predicted transcriptional regulator
MDVREKKIVDETLALSKADQQRLERLARLGGRTPKSMLRFVLRDGFDECERTIRENIEAEQEFARGESVDHADVMQSAKHMLAEYAKAQRQAS